MKEVYIGSLEIMEFFGAYFIEYDHIYIFDISVRKPFCIFLLQSAAHSFVLAQEQICAITGTAFPGEIKALALFQDS